MSNDLMSAPRQMLFSCALLGVLTAGALAQPLQAQDKSAKAATAGSSPAAASAAAAAPGAAPLNFNTVTSGRQATMLRRQWGIDEVHVRSTASGALVRFSYRVVDAAKAKILNSKEAQPYLFDEVTNRALQVPVMDQVGQLRQVAAPENGRGYWMAFSNKGRYIKPGNHVSLIIGNMRVDGLVVE
jgi:hypothetical protein